MALRADGVTAPSPVDKNAALSLISGSGSANAAESASAFGRIGGAGDPSYLPMIPVRGWKQVEIDAAGAGSANAAEYGLKRASKVSKFTTDDASNAIYAWSEADQRALAKRLWYLGLLDSPQDLGGMYKVWDDAVGMAARFAQAGNPMDPQDVLDMVADGDPSAIKRRKQRLSGGGGTFTQKSRSIDLTDPTTARALIQEAGQSALGRDLTDAEERSLVAALAAAQKANPKTATSTVTYDAEGRETNRSTTSSGGIDPTAFLQEHFEVDPEAAEHQAASTYFPWLMGALGGPTGLGG